MNLNPNTKPNGNCIFVSKEGALGAVIVAKWTEGVMTGPGFKLQKNNVAFCGDWKDD